MEKIDQKIPGNLQINRGITLQKNLRYFAKVSDDASIRIAEYLVELPPVAVLRDRLHRAIEHARERIALTTPEDNQA